jgi:hypothetical protein
MRIGFYMARNLNISQTASKWVAIQRELASKLQITPASLSAMLSGKVGLPFDRFLQIVHIVKPPKDEVDKVFALYLADLGIPTDDMALVFRSYHENTLPRSARETIHQLVDRLEPHQLDALEPILNMMTRKEPSP